MKEISIIQPDDWHVHLRDKEILEVVVEHSSRIFKRCVAMPNLSKPITNFDMAKKYKKELELKSKSKDFQALVPCYLTDKMNLEDFKKGILDKYFFGAKLYPINATTNSLNGVRNIESIYPALEILEKYNAPLLIHGEKVDENISIFDREKYFIDDELVNIMKRFENLKIIDITNKIIEKIKFKNKRQKDIFINAQKSPGGLLDPIIQNRTWQGKKLKYMALEVLMNPTYLAERNMMSPSFPLHKNPARKSRRSRKK